MDQQGVLGVSGMVDRVSVLQPLQCGQGIHAAGQEEGAVSSFFALSGRSGDGCFDGKGDKPAAGPILHLGHDRLQPLQQAGADGFGNGQPPLFEIKGRNDAADGKGMGIGLDIIGKCRFGLDEDLFGRLVA